MSFIFIAILGHETAVRHQQLNPNVISQLRKPGKGNRTAYRYIVVVYGCRQQAWLKDFVVRWQEVVEGG